MTVLAEFDGYTLRHADTLADIEVLDEWIGADEAHRGIFTPNDFMSGSFAADERPSCYALEDKDGVIFYIRLSRAARVKMQFAPGAGRHQRQRTLWALIRGMAFLEVQLSRAGCEEWIFDTVNPQLKKTAEKVLGFTESSHEMVRPIAKANGERGAEVA